MQVAKHYITTWWLGGRFNGAGREIDFVPVRGIWNQSVTCIYIYTVYIYIYTHIFLVSLDIPLCLSISRRVWSNTWSFLLPQIPGIPQSQLSSSCSTVLSQDYPRLLWWKLWNCAEVFCGFRDCWKLSKCKDVRDTNRCNRGDLRQTLSGCFAKYSNAQRITSKSSSFWLFKAGRER